MADEERKKEPALKNMRCNSCRLTLYSFMKACPHCGSGLEEVQVDLEAPGVGGLHDPMDYTY